MKQHATTWMAAGLCLVLAGAAAAQGMGPGRENPRGEGGRPGPGMERRVDGPRGMCGAGGYERLVDALAHNEELAAKLGLTEEQTRKLREVMWNVRQREVDLEADLKKAGMEQARLLMSEELDEDALMKSVERGGALHTELAKLRMQPLIALKKTLTAEQLKEARKLVRRQMMSKHGGPGRHEGGRRPGPDMDEQPAPDVEM